MGLLESISNKTSRCDRIYKGNSDLFALTVVTAFCRVHYDCL